MIAAMIRCSGTGTIVSTGLDIVQAYRLSSQNQEGVFHCPACASQHHWTLTDVLVESDGAHSVRSPSRLALRGLVPAVK